MLVFDPEQHAGQGAAVEGLPGPVVAILMLEDERVTALTSGQTWLTLGHRVEAQSVVIRDSK